MSLNPSFRFKVADEDWEFEAVHQLNYRTFVEEIPQHNASESRRLIDEFHQENTYLICLDGNRLAGMMALRGNRPFSLDANLPDLDRYLPRGRSVCEIRLLSIDPVYRHGSVLPGLIALMERHGRAQGFDTAIISGTARQLRLYRHLGFEPFGPFVGSGDALFQPMVLTYENYTARVGTTLTPWREAARRRPPVSFMPGPVSLHTKVRRAFASAPVSHRSRLFQAGFGRLCNSLCRLAGTEHVQILVGSGTLANDVVAGQISLLGKPGLILTNGEFGERLADHAGRFGLSFETLSQEWGGVFRMQEVERRLEQLPSGGWLWCVHCETSTAVLQDISALQGMCAERNIRLCLDCVSSIGTVPLDLSGAYLASGVSGKGLGSLAGLALVFHNHKVAPAPGALPRYLDLGFYAAQGGIPFTHSSNLVLALQKAVERIEKGSRLADRARLMDWVRSQLRERGFQLIAEGAPVSPVVVTVELPPSVRSEEIGRRLEQDGFLLSYRSGYLQQRNWIQICLMGECRKRNLSEMLEALTAAAGVSELLQGVVDRL